MISLRLNKERGVGNYGWLNARYTFSFANYFDRRFMGFRTLRVINQDTIEPGGGFPTHPHNDMEILTYVIQGAVKHVDSMGNTTTIPAGEVQLMSAGSGIEHSEFNASTREPLELLQIWILPDSRGYQPNYQQMKINSPARQNQWLTLVSPEGGPAGSMTIRQRAFVHTAALEAGKSITYQPLLGGSIWLQLINGALKIEGHDLSPGDGMACTQIEQLNLHATKDAEVLLFDLA
ncbi:MAG: pirin family protein [Bdellovibrionales bacterium]|nr:pirin family protein [Bdellovibrionales bacterium]